MTSKDVSGAADVDHDTIKNAFRLGAASKVAIDEVLSEHRGAHEAKGAPARRLIRYALAIGALKINGEWKTKAGRTSPYFFDAGSFSRGSDWDELAKAYAAVIASNFEKLGSPQVLYGPAYKGIPIASTVAIVLFRDYGINLDVVFNRKEAKDHGEGGELIGKSIDGRRVLLLDDVLSTGGAKREAAALILKYHGVLVGCVIALDRQERDGDDVISAVQKFSRDYDIPVLAATTRDDLILELEEGLVVPGAAEVLPDVLAYKDQYGV